MPSASTFRVVVTDVNVASAVPVKTRTRALNSLPADENDTVPVSGACHVNHVVARNESSSTVKGSPVWIVAPIVDCAHEPLVPCKTRALAKASFATGCRARTALGMWRASRVTMARVSVTWTAPGAISADSISAAVAVGLSPARTATAPATCGAEKDVPLTGPAKVGMLTPGAHSVIRGPVLEKQTTWNGAAVASVQLGVGSSKSLTAS